MSIQTQRIKSSLLFSSLCLAAWPTLCAAAPPAEPATPATASLPEAMAPATKAQKLEKELEDAKAAKERAESQTAEARTGKLIQYGITGGVAFATQIPRRSR